MKTNVKIKTKYNRTMPYGATMEEQIGFMLYFMAEIRAGNALLVSTSFIGRKNARLEIRTVDSKDWTEESKELRRKYYKELMRGMRAIGWQDDYCKWALK